MRKYGSYLKSIDKTHLFVIISVMIYLTAWILPVNIHGDALQNLHICRSIYESENLVQFFPHKIMDVTEMGQILKYPITYPQTFYIALVELYMFNSENIIKFFSPLCGIVVSAFIYLTLKPINKGVAAASAFGAIFLNTYRFIMTPLFEQYMLVAIIISLYYYYLSLKTKETKYVILAGLFLGLSAAIKQQGIFFLGIILLHSFSSFLYNVLKKRQTHALKCFLLLMLISISICFVPLFDQIERNGTLSFVPGSSENAILKTPFLEPKYPENPESIEELNMLVAYWPDYQNITEVFKTYLLYPFNWMYSRSPGDNLKFYLIFVFLLNGIIYLYKRNRTILSIILFIFIGEVFFTYITQTPIHQYHVVGLSVLPILLISGIINTKYVLISKRIMPILIASLIVMAMIGYSQSFLTPSYFGFSGRTDDAHVIAYKEIGDFIKNNISKDAIILAPDTPGVLYYSSNKRNQIWINEGGGAKIPSIFRTKNDSKALYYLKRYKINYIFFETRQTRYYGLWDYIPEDGLLSYIDRSPHFKKLYEIDISKDDKFLLYKVVYQPE